MPKFRERSSTSTGYWSLATPEGMARVAARADGVGLAWHPRPHDVVPDAFTPHVYQEYVSGSRG